MGFGFNAAKVANGLTGIASQLAYGGSGRGVTLRSAGQSVIDLGSALLNAFNPSGSFGGGGGSYGGGGMNAISSATGGSPTEWLTQYVNEAWSENGIMRYMYAKLFRDLMPDISGYTLLFMVPPDLSGYRDQGNQNYDTGGTSFMSETTQLFPLLASNFTPPIIQLSTGTLSGSAGTQHYATKLNITDSMSVSYIDTINLDIYSLHSTWLKYIFQVLEGTLEPSSEYLLQRKIDYAASFYFVKFLPNMSDLQYVGKAVGCYPRETPTQDVLGNRTSNELTTVTFNYTVSNYYEFTMREDNNWLFSELEELILSRYTSEA